MITVVVKDALRARVEAASGGAQTVLYTRRGQPSHVNIILREHLGLGEHPAFMLRGQPRQEFFYGTYPGVIRDGELLSLPGQPPASGIDFATASRAARACGEGWHLSTNAERAALMRWGNARGLASQGNTDHGRDIRDGAAHGRRVDAAVSGEPAGNPATLTGSGPDSWRHDHTPHGIADLCGNLWEWQAGLRLVDGEIQIIADNDAAHADLAADSPAWMAVRIRDGSLVPPGTPGSAKFDAPTRRRDGNAGAPQLSDAIIHHVGQAGSDANTPGLMDAPFRDITAAAGISPPSLLIALGVLPDARVRDRAQAYLRNHGERLFMSGGAWYSGCDAGLNALCLSHPRSHFSATVGARPAFLL